MMKGLWFQSIEWEEEGSWFGRLEKKIDWVIKKFWVWEKKLSEEERFLGSRNKNKIRILGMGIVFIKYFSFKKIGYIKTIVTDFVER
jgi:hypothetical protein